MTLYAIGTDRPQIHPDFRRRPWPEADVGSRHLESSVIRHGGRLAVF